MTTGLVWFRRDLRLDDNPAFAAATATHDEVVCLYVLDPRLLDAAGPHRRAQLLAHLGSLDDDLRARGGRLRARRGKAARVVAEESSGVDEVHWNDDVTPYAVARDAEVRAAISCRVRTWWGHLVLPPRSVLTGSGAVSRVFTPFYRRWAETEWDEWPEPGAAAIVDDAADALPTLDADPPLPGGAAAAEQRLEQFLARADRYLDDHDRLDTAGTSLLSADLRFGTLSPRHVIDVVGRGSPGRVGFVRQLAWRDWWAHLLLDHPGMVTGAQRPEYDSVAWRTGAAADRDFAAWCEGCTGYPVVDAAMRELRATGWMHNRARMIVGSFLVKDLLVDWRRGERWFRHWLTDGDVSQNVGNWQWVAGTGPDVAPYFRIFNPVSQSRKFDPRGEAIRAWVPEIAGLDDRTIHAPWEAGPLDLAAAGVVLDDTYPSPIVDHVEARARTLAAYGDAKAGAG